MLPIEKIAEECAGFGINLDNLAKERLDRYASLLLEWNQKMNLTAITQPEEIAEKHFLDCLYLFKFCRVEQQAKWIDVGTGAGFPGIVLKNSPPGYTAYAAGRVEQTAFVFAGGFGRAGIVCGKAASPRRGGR